MLADIFRMQRDLANYIFAKRDIRDRDGNVLTVETIARDAVALDLRPVGLLNEWLRKTVECIRDECKELDEVLPWKYWAGDEIGQKAHSDMSPGERLVHVRIELIDVIFFALEGLLFTGATVDDVYETYRRKWEKNVRRQDNDYRVATKTEEDNNEIATTLTRA